MLELDLYVNAQRRILVSSTGAPLATADLPEFYRQEQLLLRFHVANDDGTPKVFAETDAFEFGADVDFDGATAVDLLSEDDQFNIAGDWADTDPAAGLICCRVNTNTSGFNSAVGTAESLDSGCYLKYCTDTVNDVWATLFDAGCIYRNIRRSNDTIPEYLEGPTYLTAVQTAAAIDLAVATGPATEKTSIVAADRLTIWDSAAAYARKYISWSTIFAALEAAYGLLTGAQKTTLTGGAASDADALHTHAGLALSSHNHDTAYQPLVDTVATPTGATALGTVYHLSGGVWVAADPDTPACETCELWMALGSTGAAGMVAQGVVTNPAWSWTTVGGLLWLDDSGALTETTPDEITHAGRVARPVGWVRSATSIRFDGHLLGSSFEEIGS